MTPADFHAAYRPCADQVYAATGIDSLCLLAQWANETAWGQVVVGNNLGNIRCSSTSFCRYATLDDFAQAASAVWHQTAFINNEFPRGFEPFRAAAAAANNSDAVLAQIVASPWSAGHYGGSLAAYYTPLEGFELTPAQADQLARIYRAIFFPADPADPYAGAITGLIKAQTDPILKAVEALPGGGGTEPPEPAEPKTITLTINAIPGTATGTLE